MMVQSLFSGPTVVSVQGMSSITQSIKSCFCLVFVQCIADLQTSCCLQQSDLFVSNHQLSLRTQKTAQQQVFVFSVTCMFILKTTQNTTNVAAATVKKMVMVVICLLFSLSDHVESPFLSCAVDETTSKKNHHWLIFAPRLPFFSLR